MINKLNCGLAIPQVFGHSAVLAGQAVRRYVSDPDVMYRCQVAAQDYYGYDAVFPAADHSILAEGMGSELNYCQDGYPNLSHPVLQDVRCWENLQQPDPYSSGRMPVTIEACRMLRRTFGDQVLVAAKIMGPMTIAGQLLGPEKLLFSLVDYPDDVKGLLDFVTEAAISYGKAQAEAGAHLIIIYDPMASPSIIPFELFRHVELPNLKKICIRLKEVRNLGLWFQCWISPKIYSMVKEIDLDLVSIDSHLDLAEALENLPDRFLVGNIGASAFLESTPEEISKIAKDRIMSVSNNKRFLLSSGCELPLESRPENIRALVKAVHQNRTCL